MFNASMNFELGEDVNALRDMVHRWSQERLKPMAQEIDKKNDFPGLFFGGADVRAFCS